MTAPARDPAADRLTAARRVMRAEADAVRAAADRLGESFDRAVEMILAAAGRVAVCGVGKCDAVGRKIAATLNSTGTRAYTLDATAAVHGDLGMVAPDDVAFLLSHSGESEELLRLLGPLKAAAGAVVAVTGAAAGTLARAADAAIVYGPLAEACPNALAPSSSTTVMLAIGDAVAFALSDARDFGPADFAKFHPGGSLGRKLATVEQYMRRGPDVRTAPASDTVREVFARGRHDGRRTGAVMLVDAAGRLAGLFTDSDLARLFETRDDGAFDRPVGRVMTTTPVTTTPGAKLTEAVELLRTRKLSELPVIDGDGRPVGMLDITDVIGVDPAPGSGGTRPPLRLFARPTG